MLNLIKKDLKLIFARRWILILFLLISGFIIKISNGDGPGVYNWIVLSVYFTTIEVLNANDNEDMLIHSLSISKYDVVLGKYGLMFIVFLLCYMIISIITEIFFGLNIIKDISYFRVDFFKFTFLMTILANSIGIPLLFYLGKKSRLRVTLSLLLYNIIFYVIKYGLSGGMASEFIAKINSPLSSLTILSLMIISVLMSFKGYENWEV